MIMKDIKTFETAGFLLDKLHLIQDGQGYIDEKSIELIADELNMSKAEIYGAATYYKNFKIENLVSDNNFTNHNQNNNHNNILSSDISDYNISHFDTRNVSGANNSAAAENCKLNNLNNNNKLNEDSNLNENQNNNNKYIINKSLNLNSIKIKSDFVFKRIGKINPDSLDDYKNQGGFKAIENVLYLIKNSNVINDTNDINAVDDINGVINNTINNANHTIDANDAKNNNNKNDKNIIIDILKKSGLRGRGGAGFSVGIKWETVFNTRSIDKYVVCNADEGDMGAFIDRSVMENDPFMLIEGIIIAAVAVGAKQGFIYVRSDYQNGIERLKNTINLCYQAGYLGNNIFNSDNIFDLKVIAAGGNYVCGEETALLESIENKRGMVRVRPPVPAISGLYDKPTVLNNVTTFASAAYIFGNLDINIKNTFKNNINENNLSINQNNDSDEDIDSQNNKNKNSQCINNKNYKDNNNFINLDNLKIERLPFPFQLSGAVKNAGIYELSNEITLKYLIYDMGGGSADKEKKLKAAQIGGPLGAFFPLSGVYSDEFYNLKLDFEDIANKGGMLGHGGIVVYDEYTSMKDLLKETLNFCVEESCGKCAPCRIGSIRLKELFERIFKENIDNKIKHYKDSKDNKEKNHNNYYKDYKDNKVENIGAANETKSKIITDNLDIIYEILDAMKNLSLCGFGSGICLPVESLLKYFGDEILS
ncbi:MAG: complex I 51 kDa subunit family protein [bacterium]